MYAQTWFCGLFVGQGGKCFHRGGRLTDNVRNDLKRIFLKLYEE